MMFNYLKSLVRTNSGHSSKSFFLVSVTLVGIFILIIIGGVMIYDVAQDGEISTDLTGLATIIGAVTTLFTSAGLCKVYSEKNENKRINEE